MRLLRTWEFLVVFGVTLSSTVNAQVPSILNPLRRATVFVSVLSADGEKTGSGVLLSADGVVATAAHVLRNAKSAKVRIHTGEEYEVDGVLFSDFDLDLAIVKISGFALPAAQLGNSDSVAVGQRLLAVGSPLGLEGTVSDGLLSAVRLDNGTKMFQVSIPVSPGSSGGPVATQDGTVIGLVVSQIRGTGVQNLNFVLPINYVRARLQSASARTPTTLAKALGESAESGASVSLGLGDVTVNDSLPLNWNVLDGVELILERSNDQSRERTRVHTRYAVTRDPSGRLTVERHQFDTLQTVAAMSGRVTMVGTRSSKTVFLADRSNAFEEEEVISPERVGTSTARIITRGGDVSLKPFNGAERAARGLPRGVLAPSLVAGALAAYKGLLPDSLQLWHVDAVTGAPRLVRFRLLRRETRTVPILADGISCDVAQLLDYRALPVVVGMLVSGTEREEITLLDSAPHLRVSADLKCLRLQ